MQQEHTLHSFIQGLVLGNHNNVRMYFGSQEKKEAVKIPPFPAHKIIGREHILNSIKARILQSECRYYAFTGMPGVGKTALALSLVYDLDIINNFPDGLLWAKLGKEENVYSELLNWAIALEISPLKTAEVCTLEQLRILIQSAIGKRKLLLIIDDAWTAESAAAFKVGGPTCVHILTSRLAEVSLSFAGTNVVKIAPLNEEASFELLESFIPLTPFNAEGDMRAILERVGGLPLAIILIGKYLQMDAFNQQSRRFKKALEFLNETKNRNQLGINEVIDLSFSALPEISKYALCSLNVFSSKPNSFSEEAAIAITNCTFDTIDNLLDFGLLEAVGDGRYCIHQVIADYIAINFTDKIAFQRFVDYFLNYAQMNKRNIKNIYIERANVENALSLTYRENQWGSFLILLNAFNFFLLTIGATSQLKKNLILALSQKPALENLSHYADALLNIGQVEAKFGNYLKAKRYYIMSAKISSREGFSNQLCKAFLVLSSLEIIMGNLHKATSYVAKGVELAESSGNCELLCDLNFNSAKIEGARGLASKAEELMLKSLHLARKNNDNYSICLALINTGAFEQGLAIAQDLHCPYLQFYALLNMGINEQFKNKNHVRSRACYENAMELSKKLNMPDLSALILYHFSRLEYNAHNFPLAEKYLNECLSNAREFGLKSLLSHILQECAYFVFTIKEDALLARKLYMEALITAKEIQDFRNGAFICAHLCIISRDAAFCESIIEDGLRLAGKINDKELMAFLYFTAGDCLTDLGNFSRAAFYLNNAIEIFHELKSTDLLNSKALLYLGRIYLFQNKVDLASRIISDLLMRFTENSADSNQIDLNKLSIRIEIFPKALFCQALISYLRNNLDQGHKQLKLSIEILPRENGLIFQDTLQWFFTFSTIFPVIFSRHLDQLLQTGDREFHTQAWDGTSARSD